MHEYNQKIIKDKVGLLNLAERARKCIQSLQSYELIKRYILPTYVGCCGGRRRIPLG